MKKAHRRPLGWRVSKGLSRCYKARSYSSTWYGRTSDTGIPSRDQAGRYMGFCPRLCTLQGTVKMAYRRSPGWRVSKDLSRCYEAKCISLSWYDRTSHTRIPRILLELSVEGRIDIPIRKQ